MSGRVEQEPGFVLHARPYRESSVMADLLTARHGLVPVIAAGSRRRNKQGAARFDALQPFVLLALGWTGQAEQKSLTAAELVQYRWLQGEPLVAGLYANELLVRLLPREDAQPRVFAAYTVLLEELADDFEAALRRFEMTLLAELGYGVDFAHVANTGAAIVPDGRYRLVPHEGFIAGADGAYEGAHLLDVAAGRFDNSMARLAARRTMRQVIATHLGDKPLKSRELLQRSRRVTPAPDQ